VKLKIMTTSSAAKKAKTDDDGINGSRKRNTVGVMDYLQSALPRDELLDLYQDESRGKYVCRAVLQRLPQASQQVVVRLSCCGGTFPKNLVSIWVPKSCQRLLNELKAWSIIVDAEADNVTLTQEFYKGLKDSLQSLDSSPWNALATDQMAFLEQEASKQAEKGDTTFPYMTPDDLERYTQTQWDAVLHYLVGTPNLKVQPNPAVVHFLLQTDLMQPDPDFSGPTDDAPLVITQKGYDFMLQDNAQQVWHFVVQYLYSIEQHTSKKQLKREALLLLICLSFARFGDCYTASSLSKDGRLVMKDLALFGLLYMKKIGKSTIFYPTRVAMQLVGDNSIGKASSGGLWSISSKALESSLSHPEPEDSSHLAIIVQTNFQLCAYTTSELHVSMLGLFCDVQTIRRLPNIVFMIMTRDSIKAAFTLGIQAQQILRFLEKHAHPKLRKGTAPPIPPNVTDQIYLWDRERHRLQWNDVYTHQCVLHGEFQAVSKYTTELNAHAWSSEGRNQLFIKYEYAERVQKFVRKWRAKAAGGG
jgi:transcription initiation factor TFIIH subunit 4